MEKKYYLYLHKYQTTGEVFYIGIGSSKDFKRAFTANGRNKYWQKITNENKFSIEIVLTDLTKEEAFQKEKEFILFYGRKDLGTGTLVNMAAGGEGLQEWSMELREKLRQSKLGKKLSQETVKKITGGNNHKSKKVLNLSTNEIFSCIKEASEKLGIRSATLGRWLNGKRHNPTQLVFLDDNLRVPNKLLKEKKIKIKKGKTKNILQFDFQSNLIQEFNSIKEAGIFLGLENYPTSIGKNARGTISSAYGYIWKYK
jgi:hypothetical protein